MNKKLSPLERINDFCVLSGKFMPLSLHDDICEVRKALKDYKILEKEYYKLERIHTHFIKQYNQLMKDHSKKLKALEIIKEKRVDCLIIVLSQSYNEYNDMCETEEDKLTKEEFDLLKEILK